MDAQQAVAVVSIVTAGLTIAIGSIGPALGEARAVAEAREKNLASVVWTFDPPPKVFFGRARQLTPLAEKLARIARLGPDFIVLSSFCRTYAARSARAFLNDLARIGPEKIHVGADFRFGAKQSGDTTLLARHFDVALAPAVLCDGGKTISSSRMRDLRNSGRMSEALALQGELPPSSLLCGALLTEDLRHEENLNVRF